MTNEELLKQIQSQFTVLKAKNDNTTISLSLDDAQKILNLA